MANGNGSVNIIIKTVLAIATLIIGAIAFDMYQTVNKTAQDVGIIKSQFEEHQKWAQEKIEDNEKHEIIQNHRIEKLENK
jgi:hypothetical protein